MSEKALRVLFNTFPLAFHCPGGGEVQIMENKAALERRGVEVLLYNPWEPQFDQVDIVHFFSVQGGTMPVCDYTKRLGLPLCISPILWLGEGKEQYHLAEIGQLLGLADMVLPNSFAEGELLSQYFGMDANRFCPIVNGVDERFHETGDPAMFREAHGLSGSFVLCVANIEPRKNQLRLIRAVKGTGVRVVLVGRVRDREYWEACKKELDEQVIHVGHVEYGSAMHRSAYAGCDGFILPTMLETPGLAALEAACAGVPVCVTQEGCTREYFGEHALYVNPLSEESIREGVLGLKGGERDGALAQHIRSEFSWDRAAEQLCAAYELAMGFSTRSRLIR